LKYRCLKKHNPPGPSKRGVPYIVIAGIILFYSIIPCTIASLFADDDIPIIIIGNRNLPFDTLTRQQLVDIFIQKKTMWENNEKLSVVLLEGGDVHKLFLKTYLKKSPIQYTLYWKKLVFTGKGHTPITFRTEGNLMKHVALTGGAIGYISSAIKPHRVKVINIVD
jgi:hypothetical protein